MKTLVYTSYTDQKKQHVFEEKFKKELERDDVIYKGQLRGFQKIENALKDNANGINKIIMVSDIDINLEHESSEIVDLLTCVKNYNKFLRTNTIDIVTGSSELNLDQGSAKRFFDHLPQYVSLSLLHGDSRGDITDAVQQRLKGVIDKENFSASEILLEMDVPIIVLINHVNIRNALSHLRNGHIDNSYDDIKHEVWSYQPYDVTKQDLSLEGFKEFLRNKQKGLIPKGLIHVSDIELKSLSTEELNNILSKKVADALYEAIDNNDLDVAKHLIAYNGNKILDEERGLTPLMLAQRKNCPEIMHAILENEATDLESINLRDKSGLTVLLSSIMKDDNKAVEMLLKYEKTDPNLPFLGKEEDISPLILAVSARQSEIVTLLLGNERVDVNELDQFGNSALAYAVYSKNSQNLKAIIMHDDTDPNLPDTDGKTALLHAVENGNAEAVSLILENAKTDPNLSDRAGLTPLIYAAKDGRTEIVEFLLANTKIDPNKLGPTGHVALFYAQQNGHDNIVQLITDKVNNMVHAFEVDPSSNQYPNNIGFEYNQGQWTASQEVTLAARVDQMISDKDQSIGTTSLMDQLPSAKNLVIGGVLAGMGVLAAKKLMSSSSKEDAKSHIV